MWCFGFDQGVFWSWDDHGHARKVLGIAGNEPLKTLSKRLDEHVGDWPLTCETGALLLYVIGPKAMSILSVLAIPGLSHCTPTLWKNSSCRVESPLNSGASSIS